MNFKKIGLILSIIASVIIIAFAGVKVGTAVKDKLSNTSSQTTQTQTTNDVEG